MAENLKYVFKCVLQVLGIIIILNTLRDAYICVRAGKAFAKTWWRSRSQVLINMVMFDAVCINV